MKTLTRARHGVLILAILASIGCSPKPAADDSNDSDQTGAGVAGTTGESASASTAADPLRESAQQWFQAIPDKLDAVREQPLTAERVALGHQLFFDPRLSGSHTISCNSCHNLGTAGADNVVTSTGHGGQKGPRNSPTVLNSVFNATQFWDGRAPDLKEQAKGPVRNPVEMHNTIQRVEATLNSMPGYVQAFEQAFPGQSQPVSFENMAVAIEAFEATLITPDSRFDQYLAGKAELDQQERKGLSLFIDKGCVACHSGTNVGGQAFFAFGTVQRPDAHILPPADKGRAKVTKQAADDFVFRAAPLRNVAQTAPYFHSGQVWDLGEAIRIMAKSQLGQDLTEPDVAAITRFLHTLDGRPPQVSQPLLPTSTASTPHPL